MLAEQQIKRVWEGWLSSEIRSNYFADLAGRYYKRERVATWMAVFSSSAAFIALVTEVQTNYPWVSKSLTFLTAGLVAYALVAQHQKFAIESAELHARWNKLAREYEELWDDMYQVDASQKLHDLASKGAELSKIATAFPARTRLLRKWQDHVEQHHSKQTPAPAQ